MERSLGDGRPAIHTETWVGRWRPRFLGLHWTLAAHAANIAWAMARPNLHRLDRELEQLAAQGLSSYAFRREAVARVRHVVPADAFCFSSADPRTLVMTATATEGVERSGAGLLYRNEYAEQDFAKHRALASGRRTVQVLEHETDGDLERSTRYRELLRPMGIEHELRAAAIEHGATWGFLHLFRRPGRRGFDADEVELITAVSRRLAAGVRAAELTPAASAVPVEDAPSLVLLDAADRIVLASGGTARWLARLRDPETPELPDVFLTLAALAREQARRDVDEAAAARVRGDDGAWWLLHATCTTRADGSADDQVAVIVQPASGPDLVPLLLGGFGLNDGERAVTQLVLQGRSTKEIADELFVSPWTVQDRLKRIFAKAGVRSRRELVAALNPAA